MTTCANCGTIQGPFIKRVDGLDGLPVCGYPPRYRDITPKMREDRVRKCNALRFEKENADG